MENAAPPGGYAESIDSLSPRSRGGESWDETFPSSANIAAAQLQSGGATAAAASKLRLMCSYGGQIVPRPHDRTLCYLGGETRIVVVERQSSLADLQARLSRYVGGRNFCVKYQLPSEDLDSLISVTTDEDLENMIEEYDRVAAGAGGGKPLRLRLFLFPAKPESTGTASSIGSLLDDSKSETWFVDALNNAMLGRGRSSADSVNCLLGIDESKTSANDAGGGGGGASTGLPPESESGMSFPRGDSSGKIAGASRQGAPEIHSVPNSPMLGTFSSFGSASSAPSLSNLPPIRVRPDDLGPDRRAIVAGLEEQFAQMNFSDQKPQPPQVDAESFNSHLQHHPPPPQLISVVPAAAASATGAIASPAENPNSSRILSSEDDKSDHGGFRRSSPTHPLHQQPQQQQQLQQQQQQQQQQNQLPKPGGALDLTASGDGGLRSAFYQERPPPTGDPNQEPPPPDAGFKLPVQVNEKGFLLQQHGMPLPPMQAVEQLQPQQQPSQQQFVQANPHLLHHHAGGAVLPIGHYYHQMAVHSQPQLVQDPHAYNPQMPMYFLPVRQNPAYNLPSMSGESVAAKPAMPVLPAGAAPAKQELYRPGVNAGASTQPLQPTQLIHLGDQSHQFVGYSSMHHPRPQSTPGYAYDYGGDRPQQIYYTQAAPPPAVAMPPQYYTAPPLQQQPGDPKQGKAS